MTKNFWLRLLLVSALLAMPVWLAACSNEDDPEDEDDTSMIDIRVLEDDLFDLNEDDLIGKAKFSKKEGQVGVRVQSVVGINSLSRFPGQKIAVRLELLNQDAARTDWPPIEWVQETNEEELNFVIPLVETIPSLLNFRLYVYYYQFDDEDEKRADDDTTGDDDTTPADDDDDDTTPGDDDTTADDDDDTPADDDDTTGDDDDDATPEPTRMFAAEGIYTFLVNRGQAASGD
jgi:hypothetical protein